MHSSLSLLLVIASLSVIVSGFSGNSKYGALKGIKDGRTYEFNPVDGEFYETRARDCTKPGPMCDDCLTLYTCIQIGEGFIKEKLEDCSPGTCLASTASCTTGPNLECDDNVIGYNFTCHQVGLFPDPFNCQKYHLCLPDNAGGDTAFPVSLVRKCPGKYYYDPKTTLCRKKLVDDTCPVVVPPCTAAGQSGNIPSNPALYYVCLTGSNSTTAFPNLFVCPNDMVFDLVTKICVDSAPVAAAGADGKCVKVGKFYDPTSCMFYYDCTAVAVAPIRRACDAKMHFEHISQTCIDFTCYDAEWL